MKSMKDWQKEIHEWAVRKEWRGPDAETQRTTGDDHALIVSEVSESLEAFRESNDPLAYWETYSLVTPEGTKFKNLSRDQVVALGGSWSLLPDRLTVRYNGKELEGKPEGVGPELADAIIRILDYAEHVGLDMDLEVERKMAHNEKREIRHGGMHL